MQETKVSWSARWLSSSILGSPKLTAPVPYFRKKFQIGTPIKSAVLHITALGIYECEINGRPVGDHVFAPGWTEYRKRVYFQSYDVGGSLTQGENVIGVTLGDGWYAGYIAHFDRQNYGERPQFLLQLEVTFQDGSSLRIVSDDSWKTSPGPILESDLFMGETYDARRELEGWSGKGYEDSSWAPVLLAPDPKIIIEKSPGPPVRRHEILASNTLNPAPAGADKANHLIYDFGQNFTGRIRLTVRGPRGLRLTIRHAEILNKDGSIYTENLRAARCTDSYTAKGSGSETWEPKFTFHGFRYAEISWWGNPEMQIEKVEGIVLHSDTPLTGTFRCSHPLLNQLAHNILWGQKSNFLEVPTDCPQRDERLGWTGDAQVFIRTAAFNMDVRGFFHKWLQDMRDDQSEDGQITFFIPHPAGPSGWVDSGPAWADAALICPWTIYQCYGDLDILREHFDCMSRYMDYLVGHKVKDFIRAHPDVDSWGGFGDWLALDGTGRSEGGTPRDLIGTAHYANNAKIMAQTAELLGQQDEAKRYRDLHGKIAAAFRNRFVTPDGLVTGSTQTAYVLALHFDLVPEKARANAARELVRNIEKNGMHLATGFVGTPYLLHVLEATGHLDTAYKLLEQETFPSWLFPVKNGATTIWERWDGWTPEKGFQDKAMNSFNHYAYGAVGDWMVSTVAGLEIASPGYKKILFKPRPGGTITSAEAKLRTPHGDVAIKWEIKDEKLHLDLIVPADCAGTLSLPDGWQTETTGILAPGKHRVTASLASK